MEVTPDGNGDEMPGIFNIFSQLHPAVGTLFASVDLLYKKVSSDAESGFIDENITDGIIAISGLNNMANANLPATSSIDYRSFIDKGKIEWYTPVFDS